MPNPERESVTSILETPVEDSPSKGAQGGITRRAFLKGMVGATAGVALAYGTSRLGLKYEPKGSATKEQEYDFNPLIEDLQPVEVGKLNEELTVLSHVLAGKLTEELKPETTDYNKSTFAVCIAAVKHLRNAYAANRIGQEQLREWFTFISEHAVTDVDWSEPEYSADEGQKYTNKVLSNSLKVAIRYETFRFARYLAYTEPQWQSVADTLNPSGLLTVALGPNDLHDHPIYRRLGLKSDGEWDAVTSRGRSTVVHADPERGSIEHINAVVKSNWHHIKAASELYNVDPYYIAAVISMESTDVKLYKLFGYETEGDYFQDDAYYRDPRALLKKALWEESNYDLGHGLRKSLSRGLGLLWQQERYLKHLIGDPTITEDTIDLLGALAGEDTSIGLGQVNITTAKKYGLVRAGPITTTEETPDQVLALLLTNSAMNIGAVAAYTRALVDKYETMQREGLNLYLPDMTKFSPSADKSENLLEDNPEFSPHFGVRFYGGMYTTAEYPDAGTINGLTHYTIWGQGVTSFYLYFKHEAENLGLN